MNGAVKTKKEPAECQALFFLVRLNQALSTFLSNFPYFWRNLSIRTSSVHELRLACVEGWLLWLTSTFTSGYSFPSSHWMVSLVSAADLLKSVLVAHVFEHNQAVVVGMDAFFHLFRFWEGKDTKSIQNCKQSRNENSKS